MLSRFVAISGLLFVTVLAHAGEAGRIVFVTGEANVAARPIVLGDAIQEGDELSTGADGYVYLKTVDNGFLILRPGTKARVVAYHVDVQNPANTRVKFELLSGVARAISGQAVKQSRQNFRFNTPVAAIGVRGTDFTVFTDQQTSRVAVISGGVVVSGFSGGCGPEGGGPCEGNTSRELFAEQSGQLLQIKRGQPAPQLLRSTGLSPDLTAPPRSDEPAAKASGGSTTLATTDYSLDAKKNDGLLSNKPQAQPVPAPAPTPAPTPEPPQVVVVPPPPSPPVIAPPKPPEILWGRWQAVANLPADSEALAKLKNGQYVSPSFVGSFFISRVSNTEFVLPKEGAASFSLAGSEAYVRAAGGAPVAAAIQNSRLDINFAKQSFATTMNVVAPIGTVSIAAQGDVTMKGELVSNPIFSNATLRGYLGGATIGEAGYLFSSTGSQALSAFGATRWTR